MDMCDWIVQYEGKIKDETEGDTCFTAFAEKELASLNKRLKIPRSDLEKTMLEAKATTLRRTIGTFKTDKARYKRHVVPFIKKVSKIFGGREKLEEWLAKKRGEA